MGGRGEGKSESKKGRVTRDGIYGRPLRVLRIKIRARRHSWQQGNVRKNLHDLLVTQTIIFLASIVRLELDECRDLLVCATTTQPRLQPALFILVLL